MKITVLGCGGAYGVPGPGGQWGKCDPNNPKNRRSTSAITITAADTTVLIDCGPCFVQQTSQHGVGAIEAILFTHAHLDHVAGLYAIAPFMRVQKQDLPLYADTSTREELTKRYDFLFNGNLKRFNKLRWYFAPDLVPNTPVTIGALMLTPFLQQHGDNGHSLGFRAGNFAYSTDVSDFPPASEALLTGLHTWMVDCTHIENLNPKHGYLEKVLAWHARFKPQRLVLTHMSSTMDYASLTSMLPPEITPAYDGMELLV